MKHIKLFEQYVAESVATYESHFKVGDKVKSGELMAEIETDKATMDYESYNDGTVLYLGAEAGEAVAVNGILAIVGEKGEDYKALLNGSADAKEDKTERYEKFK